MYLWVDYCFPNQSIRQMVLFFSSTFKILLKSFVSNFLTCISGQIIEISRTITIVGIVVVGSGGNETTEGDSMLTRYAQCEFKFIFTCNTVFYIDTYTVLYFTITHIQCRIFVHMSYNDVFLFNYRCINCSCILLLISFLIGCICSPDLGYEVPPN